MSTQLDRPGIFKAKPIVWNIYEAKSGAVAVNFTFRILAKLEDGGWVDWSTDYDVQCYGAYYVIKKDGTVNTQTVEQLVRSLDWNGDLGTVFNDPPDCEVQITVNEEIYDGDTNYKAGWMNPGDYTPSPSGASQDEVKKLQSRFGSLLRAAAASAKPKTAKSKTTKKGTDDDDVSF